MRHGTCLFAGASGDGGIAPVPQRFLSWWEEIKSRWVAQLASELAVLLGVPPGMDIVIQAVPPTPES
jgi:hypothetical protein